MRRAPRSILRLSLVLAIVGPIVCGALENAARAAEIVQTQESLKAKDEGEVSQEANRLLEQGKRQYDENQFEDALQSWQKSLQLYNTIKDRKCEVELLNFLGKTYRSLAQYAKAIESYEKGLTIARELNYYQGVNVALNGLGDISLLNLRNGANSQEYYLHNPTIITLLEAMDKGLEELFPGRGKPYLELGGYADTIEYYEKRLALARSISDRQNELMSLESLRLKHLIAGDTLRESEYIKQVIEHHKKSLEIARKLQNQEEQSQSLTKIADSYSSLGNYTEAIRYYEQALEIDRKLNYSGIGLLGRLGSSYSSIKNYIQAAKYYEEALAASRKIEDKILNRKEEEYHLSQLGYTYDSMGDYAKSIKHHQQSLLLKRKRRDLPGEASSLNSIGAAFVKLKQPEIAIVFYKQYVNVIEGIRQDNKSLGL